MEIYKFFASPSYFLTMFITNRSLLEALLLVTGSCSAYTSMLAVSVGVAACDQSNKVSVSDHQSNKLWCWLVRCEHILTDVLYPLIR